MNSYWLNATEIAETLGLYTHGGDPHYSLVMHVLQVMGCVSKKCQLEKKVLYPGGVLPEVRWYLYQIMNGESSDKVVIRVKRKVYNVRLYTQKEGRDLSKLVS